MQSPTSVGGLLVQCRRLATLHRFVQRNHSLLFLWRHYEFFHRGYSQNSYLQYRPITDLTLHAKLSLRVVAHGYGDLKDIIQRFPRLKLKIYAFRVPYLSLSQVFSKMANSDVESSYVIEDTPTLTLSAHPVMPVHISPDSVLYNILALAQTTSVDILPITHQPVLGTAGQGATTVIQQSSVGPGFELAFKAVESGPAFLREMSFLCCRFIRQHPFMVTLEGICWSIDETRAETIIEPVMVFEKSPKGDLWSFMHNSGKALTVLQRLSLCIQIAIALRDLEKLSMELYSSCCELH